MILLKYAYPKEHQLHDEQATNTTFVTQDGLRVSVRLCRIVKTLPCVAVFMSSLTIVSIAVDRYRIIVHSTARQVVFIESYQMFGW